ncbi:unnamed protein product [Cuscuta epithymum]|uniref:Uncharacterized protein n=1 Tax=Cuscuta epithymum TaxID=186058 RepID=A0AAV0FQA1_9ASTE|nr:unnamed protein product [Cuscuta epithymum]
MMDLERHSDDDSPLSPLSFRYLEVENDRNPESGNNDPPSPPPQELFYFFSDVPLEKHRMSDSAVEINGTQRWDYFRSHSFSGKRESGSGSGSERVASVSRKVNISSLTSMSSASRRRMFMFGPVRFKPEMDLVAIKERQRRRLSPKKVLPATVADEGVVANGGDRPKRRGVRSRLWDLVAKRIGCLRVDVND